MTEPTNPLDVIGPLLPLKVAQDKYDEDTYLLLSNDGLVQFDRDCSDKAALNAIASIVNAAPAQAAEIERLKEANSRMAGGAFGLAAVIDAVKSDNDRLRADNAKLREFACHKKGCAKLGRYGAECSCGFDRVLAETEPK